jgi:hypothetical protein
MNSRNGASFVALLASFLLAGTALWPTLVIAEGAIAIGVAPGGVTHGFASGGTQNRATMDLAKTEAINGCHKSPGSNADAQKRCAVVLTFHNQCFAQALDPKDGTPGVGWAIGANQQAADDQALSKCRATAGADRRDFCKITDQRCDGAAGPAHPTHQ